VYPDGTSFFVPGVNKVIENVDPYCIPRLEATTQSNSGLYTSLSSPTSMAAALKRRDSAKMEFPKIVTEANRPFEPHVRSISPKSASFDVDSISRKNNRKLDILAAIDSNLGGIDGNEDNPLSDTFFDRIRLVSSRPSSTGSNRPDTIPNNSQIFPMPNRPLSALARWGASGVDLRSKSSVGSKFVHGEFGMHDSEYLKVPSTISLLAGSSTSSLCKVDYSSFGL